MRSLAVRVVVERRAMMTVTAIMMKRKMQMESCGEDTPERYLKTFWVWYALITHFMVSWERYIHGRDG